MRLKHGGFLDAKKIAELYIAAFPDSVRFFFKKKAPTKLLILVTNSFGLKLLWGGQAILAQDSNNQVVGYCIYSMKPNMFWKNLSYKTLNSTLRMGCLVICSILPSEVIKLAVNQLVMAVCKKRDWHPPPENARIVSIAVSPEMQGLGIGTKLLNAAVADLHSHNVFLNVRSNNKAGRKMYENVKFQYYGKTKDLLGEWLMMVWRENIE